MVIDQDYYFAAVIGLILVCLVAGALWRPPSRSCPACGKQTPVQNRRCRHCEYMFSRV